MQIRTTKHIHHQQCCIQQRQLESIKKPGLSDYKQQTLLMGSQTKDHQETIKWDVHHVNLSSFPLPIQGDVLVLNCGIPQRRDKGKIKTSTSNAMRDKNHMRKSSGKTSKHGTTIETRVMLEAALLSRVFFSSCSRPPCLHAYGQSTAICGLPMAAYRQLLPGWWDHCEILNPFQEVFSSFPEAS